MTVWLIPNISFDVFSRIPFTIQRLCELLTDPKRNYTGTDKFLMGLEKVTTTLHFFIHSSTKISHKIETIEEILTQTFCSMALN